MLAPGTLVWATAKVGDKYITSRRLKAHGHLWIVDGPADTPGWVWCRPLSEAGVFYDFHTSELVPHQAPHPEGTPHHENKDTHQQ